jgi:hypothetical protein
MPTLARGGPILRVLARELLEACRLGVEPAGDVFRERQRFVAAAPRRRLEPPWSRGACHLRVYAAKADENV